MWRRQRRKYIGGEIGRYVQYNQERFQGTGMQGWDTPHVQHQHRKGQYKGVRYMKSSQPSRGDR